MPATWDVPKFLRNLFFVKSSIFCSFSIFSETSYSQLPDYSFIVDRVTPCVVSISAVADEDESHPYHAPLPPLPQLEQTLNVLEDDLVLEPLDHMYSGSGITFRQDGFIVTNNHIVQGTSQIFVRLSNGLLFPAQLFAADPASDLAVLKIDSTNLNVCRFIENDDGIRAGQYILGFGAPFSLPGTVTEGIISYVNRPLPVMGVYAKYILFIQTDLEINPGNSGGPIVNRDGDIIGLNSHLLSDPEARGGISFAIPIKLVLRVANELINQGYASRGTIGIEVADIPPDIATVRRLGLESPYGAIITAIEPDSPAEGAGVLLGDVIVAVNHTVVRNQYELNYEIGLLEEGDIIRLSIVRDGRHFATQAISAHIHLE